MKKNISLIGMPAVGKSTTGILLAKEIGFDFIDTDILIQSGENQKLEEIIARKGLKNFLEIEEKYILATHCSQHVIATGGSAVYRPGAMAHLTDTSTIVYLAIDLESLSDRLSDLKSRGVAITPGQDINGLYDQRTPLYEMYSHVTIPCTGLRPGEIVKKITDRLFDPQKR